MQPKIEIILPVHNRIQTTLRFLGELKAQTYRDIRLIVVDDGSKDGTSEAVKRQVSDAVIIQGNGTLWWAGSLHKGYHWLKRHYTDKNDLVLLINDDVRFEPRFLESAVEVMASLDRALLCAQCFSISSGKLLDAGINWDWRGDGFSLAWHDAEVNCFSTRGLFLRVGDFIDLGGFHPKLLPHYLSDYEFTMRANRRGFHMVTSPTVRVYTDESASGISNYDRSSLKRFLAQYFSKRNYRHPVHVFFFILFACPTVRQKVREWWKLLKETGTVVFGLQSSEP